MSFLLCISPICELSSTGKAQGTQRKPTPEQRVDKGSVKDQGHVQMGPSHLLFHFPVPAHWSCRGWNEDELFYLEKQPGTISSRVWGRNPGVLPSPELLKTPLARAGGAAVICDGDYLHLLPSCCACSSHSQAGPQDCPFSQREVGFAHPRCAERGSKPRVTGTRGAGEPGFGPDSLRHSLYRATARGIATTHL